MARSRVRFNFSAFQEIRRSPEVEARLNREVESVLSAVGNGYQGGVEPGKSRSRGYVVTTTPEAMVSESEDHALLRAIGGGA